MRVYLQHWSGDDLGFDNLKGVFLFFQIKYGSYSLNTNIVVQQFY